jgi:hypothetical protein
MAKTKRPTVEELVAEARLAALRQDPRVIVHERTTDEPYEPVIEGTPELDILEVLGRRDPPDNLPPDPE